MGYANSMYHGMNSSFAHGDYSFSSAVELKYAYFFAPKWGIGIGAGVSNFSAKGTLNMEGVKPHYNDPAFDPSGKRYYDLHYKTENLVEQQRIRAVETPLQLNFEHHPIDNRLGIFAGLGAKGYFPFISAQSTFPQGKGSLTVTGYEKFTNTRYADPPHFGKQDIRSTPLSVKLNYSVDAIADFGIIFRLSDACNFYAGFHGSYGFLDVLPKTSGKKDFIPPEHNSLFSVNSLLTSNILREYNGYVKDNQLNWPKADEQWNRWQAGIKIGIHFKAKK
jgi:hypothetical protein